MKKIPWYVWVIGGVAIVVLIYYIWSKQKPKTLDNGAPLDPVKPIAAQLAPVAPVTNAKNLFPNAESWRNAQLTLVAMQLRDGTWPLDDYEKTSLSNWLAGNQNLTGIKPYLTFIQLLAAPAPLGNPDRFPLIDYNKATEAQFTTVATKLKMI